MNRSLPMLAAAGAALVSGLLIAGPLSPPAGPMASTYKTLAEVEPRIAVNAANTPGDATSQFKITQPGSYYLTGNIAGVAGKDGVVINAHHVTLDLRGFTISGGENGVRTSGLGLPNNRIMHTTVCNGHIDGSASDGLALMSSEAAAVRDLQVGNCGITGIGGLGHMTIQDCTVTGCYTGIDTGMGGRCFGCRVDGCTNASYVFTSDCVFERCISASGQGSGFSGISSTTLRDCQVTAAGATGIDIQFGNVVEGCRVYGCNVHGIVATDGTTIRDCEVQFNGADGISVAGGCSVLSNSVHNNATLVATGTGIRVTGDGGVIQGNRVLANGNWGIWVNGTANLISGNWSRGHAVLNFNPYPGNDSGQVLNSPGVGFTATNPWVNFTH